MIFFHQFGISPGRGHKRAARKSVAKCRPTRSANTNSLAFDCKILEPSTSNSDRHGLSHLQRLVDKRGNPSEMHCVFRPIPWGPRIGLRGLVDFWKRVAPAGELIARQL